MLVDYDRFMQSPDHELNRIEKNLGFEIDSTELQYFKTGFPDEELRHTVYSLNDLSLDDAYRHLAHEIYAALLDVATDKINIDCLELQNKTVRWSDEFERLKSPLILIDRLFSQDAERDGQIADLNQSVDHYKGLCTSLRKSASFRFGFYVLHPQ